MRLLIFLGLCLFTVCEACSGNGPVSTGLVGTWELRESYADPGDGSGRYRPVESDKIIVFNNDGTFRSNESFCPRRTNEPAGGSGTYSVAEQTFTPDCEEVRNLPFELRGDTLEISFFCVEGCGERYVKVSGGTKI